MGNIGVGRAQLVKDKSGSGANHALLSTTHTDTTVQTVSRGSLVYGDSAATWTELVIGAANKLIISDGTDLSWGLANNNSVDNTNVMVLFRKKRQIGLVPAGNNWGAFGAYGFGFATEGTLSTQTTVDGVYIRATTAAVLNSDSGTLVTSGHRRDLNPDVEFKFQVNTSATRRVMIGFFASDPMGSDTNATVQHFGLRVSTSAGNTGFVLTHSDGTTQAETVLAATDTASHTIRIVAVNASTKWQYSWDGGALTDISTNIPAATTTLGIFDEIRTLAGSAANFDTWYWNGIADK